MVTYELFYTPEAATMHKESKLSDIDERIARIEKLVGSSAGQALDDFVSSLSLCVFCSMEKETNYLNIASNSCSLFTHQLII